MGARQFSTFPFQVETGRLLPYISNNRRDPYELEQFFGNKDKSPTSVDEKQECDI